MKKIYTIILISFCLISSKSINAQCVVTAIASPYSLCIGDSTLLSATANIPGTYYTFDFNDSILPPGWTVSGGATFSTLPACAAPSLDNSPFYWSSTSGLITPEMQTADLDVSAGGTINFDFRFRGNSPGPSSCETADQFDEGVALEYSTNGGASWNLVVYLCSVPAGGPWDMVGGYNQTLLTVPVSTTPGNGNGSCGIFDNWAPYVIPIPPAAQTLNTRFRWMQPNSSGSCCDNWGLDNINVAAQPNLHYFWENGYSGYGANSQYITNLTSDTCLLLVVTDTITGALCADTVCISVDSLPYLSLSYSNPFCVGELVTLDATLSDPNISSYQWDLDNNGTYEVNTPSPVYPASGSFTTAGNYVVHFQGITGAGCQGTMDTVVNVFNSPTIGLTVTDPTVCIYDDADFQGLAFMFNPAGQSSTVANYEWDFDYNGTPDTSGATLTNISNFFPGLGTYPVILTVTSSMGCEKSDTVNVTIVDIPHGNIVAPQVCGNEFASISFNNTGLPISSYSWNFGDPTVTTDVSTNSSPTYVYPAPGVYGIVVVVGTAEGCLDTMLTSINIDPLPAGSITNTAVCQDIPENFVFVQTSADSITSYNWNFVNGNPIFSNLAAPTVEFAFGGPLNISVIITNQYGCTDTIVQPFTVHPTPIAGIGVYPICISRFTFDPLVAPNDETVVIDWNLGDGTIFNDVDTSLFNHIYTEPGDYIASLIITDQYGCIDSTSQLVHVDDSLFITMPNVLVQSSTVENDKVDMDKISSGFNLCVDYTYTIYDRWGVQVFQTHNDPYNPDVFCNACFKGVATNGAVLTPGVYFYVMQGNYNVIKSGSITIFE